MTQISVRELLDLLQQSQAAILNYRALHGVNPLAHGDLLDDLSAAAHLCLDVPHAQWDTPVINLGSPVCSYASHATLARRVASHCPHCAMDLAIFRAAPVLPRATEMGEPI